MPDPNDPLGLMSDDPLGILGDVPAVVPSVPMHIRRAKTYANLLPAGAQDRTGLEQRIALAEQGNADENTYLSGMNFPETVPPPTTSQTTDTMTPTTPSLMERAQSQIGGLNDAVHTGFENAGAGLYQQLAKTGVGLGLVSPAGLENIQSQMAVAREHAPVPENALQSGVQHGAEIAGGLAPWMLPGAQLTMPGVIAGARMHDVVERGGTGLEAAGYGGGEGLAMALIPGAAQKLMAPVGRVAGDLAGRAGLGGRAAAAVENAPSGMAMGAGFPLASATASQLSGDPERAQQELGSTAESAGIGGLLTAMMSRGRAPRPLDLRPTAEPAPVDVPILEPKPLGVDSYLPPEVIARMKTEPVERNLLSEQSRPLTEVPEPPPGVDSYYPPEVIARMKSNPVERNLLPIEVPPAEVPPAPAGVDSYLPPEVIARMQSGGIERNLRSVERTPAEAPTPPPGVDSYLPPETIARMKGAGRETTEDPLGILPPTPHPGNILPEFAGTDPAGTAPIVTASGTPRLPPMELKLEDALRTKTRRAGEIDTDMPTQEISPEIVADLNRRAEAADRAQYAKQMERAEQRSRGETPEWKAQREEWAAQAKRDSTPEARAAEEADLADIRARNAPPTETTTGTDTVVDSGENARNLFDSEAAPAPLASWFNDLAASDKMGSTPLARKRVDIVPEPRSTTEPGIAPIAPGKVSDPVEAHIRSMPEADQAAAREVVKGWDGKSDPKGMIANIDMAVNGPRELARRKAARLAAKEKANATSRPPQEKASETPAPEVRGEAEPAAKSVGNSPEQSSVRPGKPGETRAVDVADANSPDSVRSPVDTKQPSTPGENLGGRNNARRGAAINPIDEVAKLADKGVDAIGRVANRVSNEILDGEGIASVPAKALRTYEASLEQVVGRKGGEVGKEFAARAFATNNRARQLEGELAPLLRKAQETVSSTSKKGRQTANKLMELKWDGDFATARSHLVAEGKTEPSASEAAWAKAHQDLFYASGKQAEDAGVMQRQANGKEIPFRADKNRKEAIRAPEDALHYYADHPGIPDARKLFTHVAEKNDMTLEEFEKLAKTAFGERSLERPAALEQARGLKYFPTHMKTTEGEVVPLLKSNPLKMVEALATRTPQRVAFHEKFGGEDPKVGVAEYEKAGGDRAAAENLFLALSGSPIEAPGTGFKPGSGLDTFSRRLGMFMSALRASSLSVSAAVNVPESIAKTFPMAGAKTYVRAVKSLFRHPKDAQQEMENIGAMAAHEFNWHLEPGRKGEQVERIMRDVLGMPLHAVEQKNVTLSALAGYIKAGDLKAGKGTMFDRVRLNWLGFKKPEIDALMSGKATPEQYQAVATRYPEWTQGHATKGSENSRIAHSKWYQRLVIAERFPRMTVNRFARAAKSIPELWKQGEKGQAAAAVALLTGMGLTHAASGAAGLLIRSALMWQLGSATSSLLQGEDKTNAWKDFLWKSLAGALFGPSSQAVGTVGAMAAGLGENDKSIPAVLASPIYPLSVVENVVNFSMAMAGKDAPPGSPFKDLSRADAAVKFLEMRLPLTKVAANAAGALGLGERDPEMDGAMSAFWNWRRKYAPFEGANGATQYSEFRIAAKKAARMVQDGKDPTPYLEEALQAKVTEAPERQNAAEQKARMAGKDYKRPDARTEAFNSLTTSLMSRRVLDDLTPEQKKAAADYLGPATFERLSTYDQLLEAWAKRLKDAR